MIRYHFSRIYTAQGSPVRPLGRSHVACVDIMKNVRNAAKHKTQSLLNPASRYLSCSGEVMPPFPIILPNLTQINRHIYIECKIFTISVNCPIFSQYMAFCWKNEWDVSIAGLFKTDILNTGKVITVVLRFMYIDILYFCYIQFQILLVTSTKNVFMLEIIDVFMRIFHDIF